MINLYWPCQKERLVTLPHWEERYWEIYDAVIVVAAAADVVVVVAVVVVLVDDVIVVVEVFGFVVNFTKYSFPDFGQHCCILYRMVLGI